MNVAHADSLDDLTPFFKPGAPPPTQPILLAQTEVGNIGSPSKLLAQEEVGPQITISTSPTFRPYKQGRGRRARFISPSPAPPSSVLSTSSSPLPNPPHTSEQKGNDASDSEHSDSSQDEDFDVEDEDDESDGLIPKPDGEAGRPGRGGYTLEDILRWERKDFKRIKTHIQTLIDAFLDPSKSFASQDESKVIEVRDMATKCYPVLQKYSGSWPAVDMIRLRLKYTAARARRATFAQQEVAKSKRLELGELKPKPKPKSKSKSRQ